MENIVFLAVLFAAACHAGWNALIKVGLDPLSTTTLISIGSGVVALLPLPFVGLPAWAAWPWLVASVVIHLFYFASLIESYRTGDLGQVYPIARGSAPLMTATATTLWVGEKLSLVGWGGIVAVVAGVGARLSVNPNAYSLWLFVGIALVMLPYALYRDGRDVIPAMQAYWRRGFAGGALQVLSYGMAIWAMTVAPIAIVATLRETSVLFGAVVAVVVLKEPLRAVRIAAALLIVCGLVLIRLQ